MGSGCKGDKQCAGSPCLTFTEDARTITNGMCVTDGSQKTYVKLSTPLLEGATHSSTDPLATAPTTPPNATDLPENDMNDTTVAPASVSHAIRFRPKEINGARMLVRQEGNKWLVDPANQ